MLHPQDGVEWVLPKQRPVVRHHTRGRLLASPNSRSDTRHREILQKVTFQHVESSFPLSTSMLFLQLATLAHTVFAWCASLLLCGLACCCRYMHACVHACMRACVHACMRACVHQMFTRGQRKSKTNKADISFRVLLLFVNTLLGVRHPEYIQVPIPIPI